MKNFSIAACILYGMMFYCISGMEGKRLDLSVKNLSVISNQLDMTPRNRNYLSNIIKRDKKKDIWEIILIHGICWFDYKMIGSLAISKKLNTILRDTAKDRKKYLEHHAYKLEHVHYIEWHQYGAVVGRVALDTKPVKQLWFARQCLLNPMKASDYVYNRNFCNWLPHHPRPFFNEQGDFCLYGYGEIADESDEQSGMVAEYALCANGKEKLAPCMIRLKKSDTFINVKTFLNFPILLKALLDSTYVYIEKITIQGQHNWMKLFAAGEIIIPDNYKECRQYFLKAEGTKFDDLPKNVRETVEKLHKQKQKKENCLIG